MSVIPDDYRHLLETPLFAHLATVRPDGTPQVNPMWFDWDGEYVYFTNTKTRQKYKNIAAHPEVALSINDPDDPYRYLEVRGNVVRIDDDSEGKMYMALAERYGRPMDSPPPDAKDRVVYVVKPAKTSTQ